MGRGWRGREGGGVGKVGQGRIHRIRRRQGSSGLKNTPISGVICASIFGRVARTACSPFALCKHRADFARQLPGTPESKKHSYKHTKRWRGEERGARQRKRIWNERRGEGERVFEPLTDLFEGERQRKKTRGREREREFFGEKSVESRAVSKARLPKQSERLFSSFL